MTAGAGGAAGGRTRASEVDPAEERPRALVRTLDGQRAATSNVQLVSTLIGRSRSCRRTPDSGTSPGKRQRRRRPCVLSIATLHADDEVAFEDVERLVEAQSGESRSTAGRRPRRTSGPAGVSSASRAGMTVWSRGLIDLKCRSGRNLHIQRKADESSPGGDRCSLGDRLDRDAAGPAFAPRPDRTAAATSAMRATTAEPHRESTIEREGAGAPTSLL